MFSNPFCEENFLRDERHEPSCGSSTRLSRKNRMPSEINKRTQLSQSLIEFPRNSKPITAENISRRLQLPDRVMFAFFVGGFFYCRERFGGLDFPIVVCGRRDRFRAL